VCIFLDNTTKFFRIFGGTEPKYCGQECPCQNFKKMESFCCIDRNKKDSIKMESDGLDSLGKFI